MGCVHCRPDYEACAAVAESVLSTKDCGAANCVLGTAQPQSSSNFFALAGARMICLLAVCSLNLPLGYKMPLHAVQRTQMLSEG